MVKLIALVFGLLLVGCDNQTQESVVVEAPVQQQSATEGRDIPLTEVVRTENEKDLRLINTLRTYLPLLMHTYGTPGLNIAVARRGEIVWEAGFGYANLSQSKKMTPDTVFNSGSMGKVYTGMAIMKLVEEGVIDLDKL